MSDKILNNFFEVDYSEISLPIFTIYYDPLDYPEKYVSRLWTIYDGKPNPTDCVTIAETLEQARETIPIAGLIPFRRSGSDDPKIIETWL